MPGAIGAGSAVGLTFHDGKLWTVWKSTARNALELYQWAFPAAAAVPAAVLAASSSWVAGTETITELGTWKDAGGSPALYILSSQRLLMYNPVGATIEEYDNFSDNNPDGASTPVGITALQFKSSGDLYVAQGINNDYLMKYSPGAGFGKVSPNKDGGLDLARQGSPRVVAQNAYGLGVWTTPTTVVGNQSRGGVGWFLNPEGGWHAMNRNLGASLETVHGGGIGGRKFYTVFQLAPGGTHRVEAQDLPNVAAKPQFAIGKLYDVNLDLWHQYGRTDGGNRLIRKVLHGFTLVCKKSDGSDQYGLDVNTEVDIKYRLDDAAAGVWSSSRSYALADGSILTNPGPFASPDSFPMRTVILSGYGRVFYEMEWAAVIRTGNEANTPVVVTLAPRYSMVPPPHYTYDFVTDLTQMEVSINNGPWTNAYGRDADGIAEGLAALDATGLMVLLSYGPGKRVKFVRGCEFAMAPQEMPHLGVGRYRIMLKDTFPDPPGRLDS